MIRLVVTLVMTLASPAAHARAAESTHTAGAMTARGAFDVKVTPQPADDSAAGPFSRLFLAKQFHGGLEGAGQGTMLGTQLADHSSGGYVALERVSGTLNGKQGSFILQHKGTMQKGKYTMDVTVVPDSGRDELTGIAGRMTIIIEGRKHSYEFEYTLAR